MSPIKGGSWRDPLRAYAEMSKKRPYDTAMYKITSFESRMGGDGMGDNDASYSDDEVEPPPPPVKQARHCPRYPSQPAPAHGAGTAAAHGAGTAAVVPRRLATRTLHVPHFLRSCLRRKGPRDFAQWAKAAFAGVKGTAPVAVMRGPTGVGKSVVVKHVLKLAGFGVYNFLGDADCVPHIEDAFDRVGGVGRLRGPTRTAILADGIDGVFCMGGSSSTNEDSSSALVALATAAVKRQHGHTQTPVVCVVNDFNPRKLPVDIALHVEIFRMYKPHTGDARLVLAELKVDAPLSTQSAWIKAADGDMSRLRMHARMWSFQPSSPGSVAPAFDHQGAIFAQARRVLLGSETLSMQLQIMGADPRAMVHFVNENFLRFPQRPRVSPRAGLIAKQKAQVTALARMSAAADGLAAADTMWNGYSDDGGAGIYTATAILAFNAYTRPGIAKPSGPLAWRGHDVAFPESLRRADADRKLTADERSRLDSWQLFERAPLYNIAEGAVSVCRDANGARVTVDTPHLAVTPPDLMAAFQRGPWSAVRNR